MITTISSAMISYEGEHSASGNMLTFAGKLHSICLEVADLLGGHE